MGKSALWNIWKVHFEIEVKVWNGCVTSKSLQGMVNNMDDIKVFSHFYNYIACNVILQIILKIKILGYFDFDYDSLHYMHLQH